MSFEQGDRVGQCVTCRPLAVDHKKMVTVPRSPHRQPLERSTESPTERLQRYLNVDHDVEKEILDMVKPNGPLAKFLNQ